MGEPSKWYCFSTLHDLDDCPANHCTYRRCNNRLGFKNIIGKVFIIEKVRADKHSGIVRYQNVKMTVHSSDDLAIGDHVKVTGTERVYAGRYRTTIFLAKKLDINDPEYNNVESETDNTNTLAGFT